jgi:hypothetical protein
MFPTSPSQSNFSLSFKILSNFVSKIYSFVENSITSREKLVELGENNNSYFWGLEEQRQVKKSMSKLLDENNKVIKEQGEILNTIKDYYEDPPF